LFRGAISAYEFRLTVVPTLLYSADVAELARSIRGAEKLVLQQFVPDNALDPALREVRPYSRAELEGMAKACREFITDVCIRGV
jgi:pyruvate-formate lyase-activating enzyme